MTVLIWCRAHISTMSLRTVWQLVSYLYIYIYMHICVYDFCEYLYTLEPTWFMLKRMWVGKNEFLAPFSYWQCHYFCVRQWNSSIISFILHKPFIIIYNAEITSSKPQVFPHTYEMTSHHMPYNLLPALIQPHWVEVICDSSLCYVTILR